MMVKLTVARSPLLKRYLMATLPQGLLMLSFIGVMVAVAVLEPLANLGVETLTRSSPRTM